MKIANLSLVLFLLFFFQQTASPQMVGSSTKKLEACSLLTKEELAKIVGEPIANAKIGDIPAGHPGVKVTQCTYKSSKGVKSLDVLIKESTRAGDSPESIKKVLKDVGSTIEEVPGVGDSAFWSDSQLHAFKGKTLLVSSEHHGISTTETEIHRGREIRSCKDKLNIAPTSYMELVVWLKVFR